MIIFMIIYSVDCSYKMSDSSEKVQDDVLKYRFAQNSVKFPVIEERNQQIFRCKKL